MFHHLPLPLAALSGLEISLILLVLTLCFVIWRLTRHQECDYKGEPEPSIEQALRALAGSTHGHLTSGNSVELVQNESYFDEIIGAMAQAKHTIHFETFLWKDGEAGSRVSDALAEAAARGVRVRVLADAVGSVDLSDHSVERLRQAGCQVRRFHRWRIQNLGRLNVRDHRKIVVTDGCLAFVGGHCITDDWLKDGETLPRYRDITARISGPAVSSIQSCFLENWTEVSGELFTDDATFPDLPESGPARAHVAYVKADHCASSVQVLHHLCIGYAKKRIRIQNPYFLPDPSGTEALAKASRRGVDVRIMIPALTATDSPRVSRAGRYQFRRLLESGVRIFEYRKTLLHQKVITIDGVWCGIGSSNFDDRSFEINDEITVGIADITIASELERIFDEDARDAREIDPESWRHRPWRDKLLDRFLYLFNEQF